MGNKNTLNAKLLMVGLDYTGKTTIIYNYMGQGNKKTVSTNGILNEQFKYKDINFSVTEVSGGDKIRLKKFN
jgi:GTPase SAR1 family protein